MTAPAQVIEQAVLYLANQCDGANSTDGAGFNKFDSAWGKDWARDIKSGRGIDHAHVLKRIGKYRKQIARAGLELPPVELFAAAEPESFRSEAPAHRSSGLRIGVNPSGQITVAFPYNPALVEKIKSVKDSDGLSIARWNPTTKYWIVPERGLNPVLEAFPDAQLAPEVMELATTRRHEWEMSREAARKVATAIRADTDVAIACYERFRDSLSRTPYDHQDTGIRWLIENRYAILADDMGCISGNAIVQVTRGGASRKMTLRDFHARFHRLGGAWQCRALCGDRFKPHAVRNVIATGIKSVVRVTLSAGYSVVCTPDHEIARPDGAWTPAASLAPGDPVLVNGRMMGAANPNWKGGKGLIDKDGYRRIPRPDHPRANPAGHVYEHIVVAEEALGRSIGVDEHVCHANDIKSDNRPENLRVFPGADHCRHHDPAKKLHRTITGRGGMMIVVPEVAHVVSVEPCGEVDVYDVAMDDPHHNFVADGVVVHNCGKTTQALIAARALGHKTIVIAPAGLRLNWIREAAHVEHRVEVYSWAKLPEAPRGPYTLIGDEAHFIQNMQSQRTKAFLALADKAEAVFALTGTPIKNGRPANLFPILKAIRHELGKDRRGYEKRYCAARSTRWTQWDVTGSAHLEELHERIGDRLLRRMKEECLDLPGKIRVVRDVAGDLSPAARKLYGDTLAQMQADYQGRVAQGEVAEADSLVLLGHLRHAGSLAKVECATEMAREILEEGGQVVLFTAFVDSAKQIATALNADLITGEVDAEGRQATIDRFQAGEVRSIVCTLGAGNVGITLTAAQTVILVDRPWTPGDALQAEDRLYRIGQRGSVLAVWMEATEFDVGLDALLEDKQRKSETVIAGTPGLGLVGEHHRFAGITSLKELAARLLEKAA